MSDKVVRYTFTDEEKADLVARYNDLTSAEKLAKEVGCSTPTMVRNLRAWGATIRGKGRLKGTKNAPKAVAVTPAVESTETSVEVDAAEADNSNQEPVLVDEEPTHAPEESHGVFGRLFGFLG